MLELSDYTSLVGVVNTLFAFYLGTLHLVKKDAFLAMVKSPLSLVDPRSLATMATAASLTLFLVYESVLAGVKYSEGFELGSSGTYALKTVGQYSLPGSPASLGAAAIFLSAFWGTRLVAQASFIAFLKARNSGSTLDLPARVGLVGSQIMLPVYVLLQIALVSAGVAAPWHVPQFVATVFLLAGLVHLAVVARPWFKALQDDDMAVRLCLPWVLSVATLEALSVMLLSIGLLAGVDANSAVFGSKCFTDWLSCVWEFTMPLSLLANLVLMYYGSQAGGPKSQESGVSRN